MDPSQTMEEFRALIIKKDTAPGLECEEKNINSDLSIQK